MAGNVIIRVTLRGITIGVVVERIITLGVGASSGASHALIRDHVHVSKAAAKGIAGCMGARCVITRCISGVMLTRQASVILRDIHIFVT